MACAESCEFCITSCLREQNIKPMVRCIQLDRDCANICATAAAFMSRDSEYAYQICNTCAEICDGCAQECQNHEMGHCQKCAEAVEGVLMNAEEWPQVVEAVNYDKQ